MPDAYEWSICSLLGLSSTISIDGVNRSHAVYSSNDSTSPSSVVTQPTRVSLTWNRRKHTVGDRPQYGSSSSLAPSAPLFHRLSQRTTRYVAGPLPTCSDEPARLHPNRSAPVVIVFLATSLRDRNTFKQLMSESCCAVESL